MPKKERERSTRRMPSGAQQYTRGDTLHDRAQRIGDYMAPDQSEDEYWSLDAAIGDEVRSTSRARQTETQTSQEDRANRRRDTGRYAEGGMVRGCKAGQMSGKGFSGGY